MNRLTKKQHRQQTTIYSLVAMLLLLWIGGAVAHYCFDGLEPPLSVHFDNLMGHDDHEHEPGHIDIEKPAQSDNLISKIFQFDAVLFQIALFVYVLLQLKTILPLAQQQAHRPPKPKLLLPPLRAPPAYSC